MHTFAPAHRKPNPARTLPPWPPSRRCPSGTASTPSGCAPPTTGRGRRCATTSSPACPGWPRRGWTPCCARAGSSAGRRRRGRDDPFRPRRVPVVPPRPARRGAGAVRRSTSCTATSDLLVVDKPHFLATIPRGRHVVETALVRLRRELDLPDLSPAHRLDRVTAGRAAVRRAPRAARRLPDAVPRPQGAQDLRGRRPVRPGPDVPADGAQPDRQGARGDPAPRRSPGPPNAETARRAAGAPRRARPATGCTPPTGRTHQLRLHMRGLGVPILGDRFYGTRRWASGRHPKTPRSTTGRARCSCSRPTLEVPDPVTGVLQRFTSRRTLQAWTDPAGWAAGPVPAAGS